MGIGSCTLTYIFIEVILINVNGAVDSSHYSYCSPDGIKHLWCAKQHYCWERYSEECAYQCFACRAHTGWEISLPNITYLPLDIEPLNVEETNIVILSRYTPNNITYYYLKYTNRRLERIPDDLRLYRIVDVDLTGNMIREIGNITHLQDLDTLVLRHNLLTHVSNRTFVNMPYLRIVDLSYNNIKTLDFNILQDPNTNILWLTLSGNYFKELDVSNIFVPNRTICGTFYSHNKHPLTITNVGNWRVDIDNLYIRGYTDFSSDELTEQPILMIINNLKFGFKYFLCGFHNFVKSGFDCDCELMGMFQLLYSRLNKYFRYQTHKTDGYCKSPEKLKNITVKDLFQNKSAHSQLICDLEDGCPTVGNCQCTCTLKPDLRDNNTVSLLIDCSKSRIICTDMPEIVPDRNNGIVINVSGHQIRSLNTKYYFDKIEVLDLTGNPIQNLDGKIKNLVTATKVIMPDHMLKTLPKEIQLLHPSIFEFGQNGIPCNCDNVWIGEWRRYQNSSSLPPLYCSNYNGVLIEDFIMNLECNAFKSSYLLMCFLSVPVLLCFIVWRLRYLKYDLAIIKRKLSSREKHYENVWEIDVYLSYDDDNNDVRYFVLMELDVFFRRHNISSYIPSRDAWPGHTEEHNITTNMARSKYCIVIQSKGMYDSSNNFTYSRRLEYKLAYDMYVKKQLDKIIILSFDKIRPEPFQYCKSQSLFRQGLGFTIFDRKISLYKSVLKVLDEPLITVRKHRKQGKKKLKAALWRKSLYQT